MKNYLAAILEIVPLLYHIFLAVCDQIIVSSSFPRRSFSSNAGVLGLDVIAPEPCASLKCAMPFSL
jgi:hypothetical protein